MVVTLDIQLVGWSPINLIHFCKLKILDFKVLKIIWLIFSRIPIRSTGFWCWILLVFFQSIGSFCGKDLGFKGLGFTCKKTVEDVVQLESIQAEVQWPVFTSSSHSCHCGSWHNASTVPTPSQHQRILQGYRFFTISCNCASYVSMRLPAAGMTSPQLEDLQTGDSRCNNQYL